MAPAYTFDPVFGSNYSTRSNFVLCCFVGNLFFPGEPVPSNNPPGRNSQKYATHSQGASEIKTIKSKFAQQSNKTIKNIPERLERVKKRVALSIYFITPPQQLKVLPSFYIVLPETLPSRP